MILTQCDRIHAGIGRDDDVGMTQFEFRKIRTSLGLTREGMVCFLGCNTTVVRVYETSASPTLTVDKKHAKRLRKVASMPISEREQYVKDTGCQLIEDSHFK